MEVGLDQKRKGNHDGCHANLHMSHRIDFKEGSDNKVSKVMRERKVPPTYAHLLNFARSPIFSITLRAFILELQTLEVSYLESTKRSQANSIVQEVYQLSLPVLPPSPSSTTQTSSIVTKLNDSRRNGPQHESLDWHCTWYYCYHYSYGLSVLPGRQEDVPPPSCPTPRLYLAGWGKWDSPDEQCLKMVVCTGVR